MALQNILEGNSKAKHKKLWDYINEDKGNRFLQLNEDGKKTYLQYGYDNGFIKPESLTEKALSYITIKPQEPPKNQNNTITIGTSNRGVPVNVDAKRFDNATRVGGAFTAGYADSATLGGSSVGLEKLQPGMDKRAQESSPLAYQVGKIAGYLTPGGLGAKLLKPALKGITKPLVRQLTEGAILGGGMTAIEDTVKGKGIKETTKDVAINTALGAGADLGLNAIGKGISAIVKNLQAGKLSKINIDDVKSIQTNNIEPQGLDIQSKGAYKVKNTKLEKAIEDYNSAIETVQNHFKTNELRPNEYNDIKSTLGIDFDQLVKNIEDAQKPVSISDIGKIRNLANVAGVTELPTLKRPVAQANNLQGIKPLPIINKSTVRPTKEIEAIDQKPVNIKELVANSDKWKDKNILALQRERWSRNIIDIAGQKEGSKIKEAIFDPIQHNEAARQRFLNESRSTIKNLKLSKKESEIVQMVGEGKLSIDQIPSGMDSNKINNAVNTFRKWYDDVLTKANESLVRNGYSSVPKLPQYFPHFNDTDDPIMRALGIKLDMVDLPTDINGLTHQFKPGKNFVGNFLKRTGDKTTYDAVKGFDRYAESVSKVITHTDDISRLRQFSKELRLKYSPKEIQDQIDGLFKRTDLSSEQKEMLFNDLVGRDTTHLSNAVSDLDELTNYLAGKKDLADRAEERRFGRQIYNVANAVMNRISKNMVAINPSSWLTNFIPLTNALATTDKIATAKAFEDTIRNLFKNDGFVNRSTFLTNRVGSDVLDKTFTDKAGDALAAPFKWIDNFTTQVVTRAKYYEGVRKGISPEEALKNADSFASHLIGDRSLGSQPTLFNQRNPVTRLLTMFQLEINNNISVILKDMPRQYLKDGATAQNIAKLTSAVGQLALYSYLYNEMFEKATGRRPALDIAGIVKDYISDSNNPNLNKSDAILNAGQQAAASLPFLGSFIGGGRLPISAALPDLGKLAESSVKAAAGEIDKGTALKTAGKELGKVGYYLLPAFGGGQLKKSAEGLTAVGKGGEYGTNPQGEKYLKYPINKNLKNTLTAGIFGKSALEETQDYYDNNRRPLSTKQTVKIENAQDKQKAYEKLMLERRVETAKNKLADAMKEKTLEPLKKAEKVRKLREEYVKMQKELLALR